MAVATVVSKSDQRDSADADHLSDEQLDAAAKADQTNPIKATAALSEGSAQAQGKPIHLTQHNTKVTQQMIWESARPFMRGLENGIDTWECFSNALSPTPPFSSTLPRLKLAGILAPVLLVSLLLPSKYYVKGVELLGGLALFTQPLAIKGMHWLNTNYPGWMMALDLRK